ncbi:MAG: hypothetical protein HY690_17520 [Chloroflexi bacterium]|nr:hypothetical protein [Chloroflexota bacterium]
MKWAGIIGIVLVAALGLALAARVASPPAPEGEAELAASAADREAPPGLPAGGEAPASAPTAGSPTTAGSPAATASPAATPVASAAEQDLVGLLAAMADKLDAVRDAIRDRDANSLLRFQHDLLGDIQRAKDLAKQDDSREGRAVRDALDQVEAGLSGDLAKLDGSVRRLSDATVALARARGASLAPRPERVENLQRFAQDAARRVANFQKGYQEGDPSRLLRLQRDLLQLANDGLASLRNSQSPQAQQVKAALQDIQAALPSDLQRLESARLKLLEASGERVQPTPAPSPAASPAASPAPTPGPR